MKKIIVLVFVFLVLNLNLVGAKELASEQEDRSLLVEYSESVESVASFNEEDLDEDEYVEISDDNKDIIIESDYDDERKDAE